MPEYEQFEIGSMRRIASAVRRLEAQVYNIRQFLRGVQSGGHAPALRGKPAANIAAGGDGELIVYDSSGATDVRIPIHNPHGVTLETDYFVEAKRIYGFDTLVASPAQYGPC